MQERVQKEDMQAMRISSRRVAPAMGGKAVMYNAKKKEPAE